MSELWRQGIAIHYSQQALEKKGVPDTVTFWTSVQEQRTALQSNIAPSQEQCASTLCDVQTHPWLIGISGLLTPHWAASLLLQEPCKGFWTIHVFAPFWAPGPHHGTGLDDSYSPLLPTWGDHSNPKRWPLLISSAASGFFLSLHRLSVLKTNWRPNILGL